MSKQQIRDGGVPLSVDAVWIPAKPSPFDPLSQDSYLAVKFDGGIHAIILDEDTVPSTIDYMAKLIGDRVREALTVAVTRAGKTATVKFS